MAHTRPTDPPQLTARSIALGTAIGALAGASNLWVGLKIGYSLGVLLTAAVLGSALAGALHRAGVLRRPLGLLEATSMASTASAAGYSTGANLVSAVAAYVMVTGAHLSLVELAAWTLVVAMLGVFIAVPLRRRLVVEEALPFPTGTAAAQTLAVIHGGERDRGARALAIGLCGAAVIALATGVAPQLGWPGLPAVVPWPALAGAVPALAPIVAAGLVVPLSPMLWGAGALMGLRVAVSVLVGAIACHGVAAPWLVQRGAIDSRVYEHVVEWSVWLGVPLMVSAALVGLVRATAGVRRTRVAHARADAPGDQAIPPRAVAIGVGVSGLLCVVLGALAFGIPPWLGALAVILAIALGAVAARVTGETDATPTGPLGKLAQLGFGALLPGATVPVLGATSICAGAGASAADLLTDFKCGQLVGAEPRRQLIAQIAGVVVGVLVIVPLFRVLLDDPSLLGTAAFPAPAAQSWRVVAELLAAGPSALPTAARWAIGLGTSIGLVLALAEPRLPVRLRPYLPAPLGLGLAFVIPATQAVGFAVGATAFALARRRLDAATLVAVAGGLVAGESLVGVLAALLAA